VKVLVAGATGVVGRRLVPLLVNGGHEVVGTSRSPVRAEGLRQQGARGVVVDALDKERVSEVMSIEQPEVVIHELTDIPRRLDPSRVATQFDGNVRVRSEGTRNLVDAANEAGVLRVIAQSYAHIYEPRGSWVKAEDEAINTGPEDTSPRYRNVKAIGELERRVLQTPGIEGVVLRYGTLYGPGTAYAPAGSIAQLVRIRHYPIVGGGRGVTSFLHVDDAAAAAAEALKGPPGVYNICDDEPASVAEWLPCYAQLLDAPPPHRVPAFAVRALGREHFAYRSTEQRGAFNGKAKAELGWTPMYPSWRQGFRTELEAVGAAA
jgi:nucleoside-diphosphate-sugar epimerase